MPITLRDVVQFPEQVATDIDEPGEPVFVFPRKIDRGYVYLEYIPDGHAVHRVWVPLSAIRATGQRVGDTRYFKALEFQRHSPFPTADQQDANGTAPFKRNTTKAKPRKPKPESLFLVRVNYSGEIMSTELKAPNSDSALRRACAKFSKTHGYATNKIYFEVRGTSKYTVQLLSTGA